MSKEYLDDKANHIRRHGDGSLKLEQNVFEIERRSHLKALQSIVNACELNELNLNDDELDQVALVLKQRIALGFSNGCPYPETAIIEFIQEQPQKPQTATELTEMILESGRADAQCNVLYQKILKFANQTLRSELQLLKPMADKIEGQEDHNVSLEMSDNGLVAGMAYDPIFSNILVPLRDLINNSEDQQEAFNQAVEFIKKTSQAVDSIEDLVEKTSEFVESQAK